MTKKIPVYYNHGRWITACPKCGTPLPAQENGVVCPMCHPQMSARYDLPLPCPPYPPGATRRVPDTVVMEQVRAQADALGEVYYPDYPGEKQQIERVLRGRKSKNMNWEPGETLKMLEKDNLEHGDPLPPEKKVRDAL